MTLQRVIGCVLVFIGCATGAATDYYVDFVGGSDNNNGTSTGTAWKRSPGDSSAQNVPLGTTLVAGDRVLFRKNVTYNGKITIAVSGTTANPITFDGNEWGSGTASTNTTAFEANSASFTVSGARSNLHFRDLVFYQIGGKAYNDAIFAGAPLSYSSVINGYGIRAESNPRDLVFSNIIGSEIGYWTNHPVNVGGTVIAGYVMRVLGGTGHRFTDIECTKVNVGISLQDGTGLVLSNIIVNGLEFYGPGRWAIDVAAARNNSVMGHMLFTNIVQRDMHEYDNDNWLGGATSANDNPHTDGIFFRNPAASGVTWTLTNGAPTVVVDNYRWFSDDTGNGGSGTAPIFISQGPSVLIRNSYFGPTEMAYNIGVGHDINTSTQVVYIFNNAFHTDARINIENATASNPNRYVSIVNNIFNRTDGTTTPAIRVFGPGGIGMLDVSDNNLFWHTAGASTWRPFQLQSTTYTLGAWKSAFPTRDQNSIFGNPMWSNFVSTGSDCNLRLNPGSAAESAGSNLLAWVPTDIVGTNRSAPFDIGPFTMEASSGDPPVGDTDPPTPDPMTWVTEPHVTGPHTISMSWTAATDDSGEPVLYIVTETTGNAGCVGTPAATTATSFVNDNIPFNTTCSYTVKARDGTGNMTDESSEVMATTPTEAPPVVAQVLRATVNILAVGQAPQTNLFYLSAEGAGTPSGWTDSGSATDWDRADVVYAGTNVFNAGDTANFSYTRTPTFDTASSLTMVGSIWRNSVSATPRKIFELLMDGVPQAAGYYSTNGLMIEHGTTTNTVHLMSPQQNWYSYRIIYVPGAGSDGILRAWWSTNRNWSVGASNTITDGTGTLGVNAVQFGHTNGLSGNRFLFDETWARSGTTSIPGDNPSP